MSEGVWQVTLSRRADKALSGLPKPVLNALALLMLEIEQSGPVRGSWPNYGKLGPKRHHCHLKKGRPTYVAVWIETDAGFEVEVVYAGTHERAPY
jgi:hypothetical protein